MVASHKQNAGAAASALVHASIALCTLAGGSARGPSASIPGDALRARATGLGAILGDLWTIPAVAAVRLDRIAGVPCEAGAVRVVGTELGAAIAAAGGWAVLGHRGSKRPVVAVAHLWQTKIGIPAKTFEWSVQWNAPWNVQQPSQLNSSIELGHGKLYSDGLYSYGVYSTWLWPVILYQLRAGDGKAI